MLNGSRPGGATTGAGRSQSDLISRADVLADLHARLYVVTHERLDLTPSTPGGLAISGEQRAQDVGFRKGHNARAENEANWLRSQIAKLEGSRTLHALRELRDAVPTVTEAQSCFLGEGG